MMQGKRSDQGSGAVRLSGFLRCELAEDVEIIKRHLPDHARMTRAESGCVAFEVTQTADPMVWRVTEQFADRAAFDFHQRRTRDSEWFTATSHIPRDYEIPEQE